MKKSKFSEEQIVRILKGGRGWCEGRRDVPQARHQRADVLRLEEQVRRDGGVAAATPEGRRGRAGPTQAHVCRPGAGTPRVEGRPVAKRLSQARRLELSLAMQTDHGLSARRADRTLDLSRSARHYTPRPRDDSALIEAVEAHVKDNPGHGFGLLFNQALQPKGFGKTRSWRVYVAMKLNLPRRGKRRLPDRIREPLAIPAQANHTWSADFMADALWSGRRFRTFNVNDDFNRESLRIEIDTSLPSQRVIRALDELVELRGAPRRLRLDNGPEFISAALRQWAQQHDVELLHIQPGKPTQNAYIERFNRTFRTEVLDRYVFTSLHEVRRMAEDWRHRYNHQRPHCSLGGLSPVAYAMASSTTSTSG